MIEPRIPTLTPQITGLPEPAKLNRVAIIWYHQGPIGSHAGLVINGKPYGFEPMGFKSRSPSTLTRAIENVKSGDGNAEAITLLYLKTSSSQEKQIEELCKKPFVPGFTCMHIVSRIISDVVEIPTSITLSPDVSLLYLKNVKAAGDEHLLDLVKVDGKYCKIDKENIHARYGKIGIITASFGASSLLTAIFSFCCTCVSRETRDWAIPKIPVVFILVLLSTLRLIQGTLNHSHFYALETISKKSPT